MNSIITRILVVDDKEENLCYLQALLQSQGYLVEPARHGAEALVKARQCPPGAVISDLLMPIMDGYTLLRIWKTDPRLKEIPFIVYTATYTEPEDERLALTLGADAFILKPSEPDAFLARLRDVETGRKISSAKLWTNKSETEILKVYSETLIRKLEEKSLQLEESNRALQRDILARKRVEEELRWKSAFLEAQVDSSIDGILVVDNEGRKILQNQRLIDLWKIPPDLARDQVDAKQLSFVACQTTEPTEFIAKVNYLNAHPDEVSRDEIHLAGGTVLERFSSPVRDKAGKHYGRIWTFRDITERKKLEAQLRQSQKMEAFGQLAGGVAHDFNNILGVIQLHTSMLKTESKLSPEQLELADGIEKAAQRAANLTRQLLLFSRRKVMQTRDVDLQEVVQSMASMLHRTLGENIRHEFKFSSQPILIRADSGMIDQILLNLAVNARDAMPNGGRIVFETAAVDLDESMAAQIPNARAGSFACLSVTDSGCGISEEILPRIFEPFFTTKEVGKGTGLGLATVFGIVHQHKGWIGVYSVLGQGASFRVYLPRLTQAQVPERKEPRVLGAAARGGNETILLVEDELPLRVALRALLAKLGYHLLEAADGEEALQTWHRHRDQIRLVITDLVMPGKLTGAQLAKQLCQINSALKVLYISGYSSEVLGKELALTEGVNFLTKPFHPHQLAEIIRANLDQCA